MVLTCFFCTGFFKRRFFECSLLLGESQVAFQVGKPSIVARVRQWMLKSQLSETQLALSEKSKGPPLKFGIGGRRMKLQDLIRCADPTASWKTWKESL